MRIFISIAAAGLTAVLILTACNSNESKSKLSGVPTPQGGGVPATTAPPPVPADNARRITPAELKDEIAKNDVFLIDVRGESAYQTGHIKGAKLIPSGEILSHLDELPKNKLIVTYCSWPAEHTSAGAVVNLKTKGIDNAAAVLGGYEALKSAGFEVVTGKDPNVPGK